jgi:hypothetical protein
MAEKLEAQAKVPEAFDAYRRALNARIDGTLEPMFMADLMKIVGGLVRLGQSYPPAANELAARRKEWAEEITRDPSTYDSRRLEAFWLICSRTGNEAAALSVLKGIQKKDASTVDTRAYLASSLMSWMYRNKLYQELADNRDVLQHSYQMNAEMARVALRNATDEAVVLYESLLVVGKHDEARRVRDELLGFQSDSEIVALLSAAAKRAGANTEVEWLKDSPRLNKDSSVPPVTP